MIPLTTAHFFLRALELSGKSPNFWMSEEYIEKAGLVWTENEIELGYQDCDGFWFFPYVSRKSLQIVSDGCMTGFQNEEIGAFWDNEYIYNPREFLDLSGNNWKVFRRNVKKLSGLPWEYRRLESEKDEEQAMELLLKWTMNRSEIYDPEVFIRYVHAGRNRFGLFLDGVLKGVNIADTNWKYINYRFCFDTGEEFLNEFLRLSFYTSPWVLEQGKLVNDGGNLGSEGLARFKLKLRPIYVQKIYTGRKET